jgi:hypothetical protein
MCVYKWEQSSFYKSVFKDKLNPTLNYKIILRVKSALPFGIHPMRESYSSRSDSVGPEFHFALQAYNTILPYLEGNSHKDCMVMFYQAKPPFDSPHKMESEVVRYCIMYLQ